VISNSEFVDAMRMVIGLDPLYRRADRDTDPERYECDGDDAEPIQPEDVGLVRFERAEPCDGWFSRQRAMGIGLVKGKKKPRYVEPEGSDGAFSLARMVRK